MLSSSLPLKLNSIDVYQGKIKASSVKYYVSMLCTSSLQITGQEIQIIQIAQNQARGNLITPLLVNKNTLYNNNYIIHDSAFGH